MHLAHNFSHLLLEGNSIIPALQRSVNKLSPFSLGEPVWKNTPLASLEIVSFLQMVFVLVGLVVSMIVGYRLASGYGETAQISAKVLLPFLILSFCLTLLNLYLLNQPMGARYSM